MFLLKFTVPLIFIKTNVLLPKAYMTLDNVLLCCLCSLVFLLQTTIKLYLAFKYFGFKRTE